MSLLPLKFTFKREVLRVVRERSLESLVRVHSNVVMLTLALFLYNELV